MSLHYRQSYHLYLGLSLSLCSVPVWWDPARCTHYLELIPVQPHPSRGIFFPVLESTWEHILGVNAHRRLNKWISCPWLNRVDRWDVTSALFDYVMNRAVKRGTRYFEPAGEWLCVKALWVGGTVSFALRSWIRTCTGVPTKLSLRGFGETQCLECHRLFGYERWLEQHTNY